MNLFVTGVAGFSGSNVARYLLKAGHSVTAISRQPPVLLLTSGNYERLTLIQSDVNALEELPIGTEAVVHAAAASPTPATRVGDFVHDNVLATENLVRLALEGDVRKFVFFSSLSIYGEISKKLVDEHTPIVNPDAYGASKLFGELCLREQANEMASLALRLPGVLGRGSRRHWLDNTLGKARAGEPIRIFNPEAPFNNAVHIEDLCVFISRCLSREWTGFDAITLGADGQMSIRDIVSRVISVSKSSSRVFVEHSPRHSFLVSSHRAEQNYGYVPTNIEKMLDLYLTEALAES
jgi:UDP-glucose 4-epimerase